MSNSPTPRPESREPRPTDPGPDQNVVQRFERSLEFWASGKEDYPPAIRGALAHLSDLPADIQAILQKIGRHRDFPDLALHRVLWFEDKNDKLDDACGEGKPLFRPLAVDEFGLIAENQPNNQVLEKPTRHRLVVCDQFAATNYQAPAEDGVEEPETDGVIGEKSWKRKITQTLKPWAIRVGERSEQARPPSDLLLTLNAVLSRTHHGWLIADLFKLKERRGAVLTYARTFEYQRVDKKAYEFKLELFGAAVELLSRLGKALNNLASLYLEIDEAGEIFLTKAAVFPESEQSTEGDSSTGRVAIPLEARVVRHDHQPSQLALKKTGVYYETQLKPLVEQGKRLTTKIDLRKSDSAERRYRFQLKIELDAPLLVASSGEALIFQLSDFLSRFTKTNLASLHAEARG